MTQDQMTSQAYQTEAPQYGGKPLAFSLEPVLLTLSNCTLIAQVLKQTLSRVEDFTSQAVNDRATLKRLGLPENLPPQPSPLGIHIPFARFDFLFDGKNIWILELNTDGTSGYNICEWLGQRASLSKDEDVNFDLSHRLLAGLREHDPSAQEVVLMDFKNVKTAWEQEDLVKRWKKEMVCKRSDPAIRTWKNGSLIYRRALSWQLRGQPDRAVPFLEDWRENRITVVGGWSSDVGMSKTWPALMPLENCPQTLIVDEGSASTVSSEKDQWILKGALSFSGNSVIQGTDFLQTQWQAAVENSVRETKGGRPWIAQRRLEIPLYEGKPCEFGAYFINGNFAGMMVRWGHTEPISDTSSEILRPIKLTAN